MKQPPRSDYERPDATDSGDASGSARADDQPADEDEFPSEATRIDNRHAAGVGQTPQPRPTTSSGRIATSNSARIDTRRPAEGPRKIPSNAKLAALQSLSLDGGTSSTSSTRLPPEHRGQGSSKLPWVLLCLVLAGVGGNWAWNRYHGGGGGTDPTVRPAAIKTEIVHPTGGNGQVHMAAGFTAARAQIPIGAPAGGRIKDVKVQNGDKVKRGQLLFTLDDSGALAELSQVQTEVSIAERNYSRMKQLFAAQAATSVDLERARGQVEIARARLRPIEQRISAARIKWQQPNDVTVLEVVQHPGEVVSGTVLKLADLTQLDAETDINESDLGKIHRGQAVVVTSDAFSDKTFNGTVREIAGTADKAKGTVQVKVELTGSESLRPGISVKCAFQPEKGEKPRIFISHSALTPQNGVWVVGGDKRVTHRVIKTAEGSGGSVEVTEGLRGGEEIIVEANQGHEGQVLAAGQ